VRVSQERTLEGRLLQIAGADERKPRAPNEMLQQLLEVLENLISCCQIKQCVVLCTGD